MIRKTYTLLMALFMLVGVSTQAQDLVISGVIDGPLPGGQPKAIEVYVINNVADMSVYGLGSANNGGGSDGEEFTFPADSYNAGDFVYVASEDVEFNNWFGFDPDYTDDAANINGDDAIELFMNGGVIDVFGDIDLDGTGEPWEYLDGWAYRVDGTGPDGSTFVLGNFSYSGPDALDGETSNASAATPFPVGTYTAGAASNVSTPIISPASGDYFDPITVTITCGTDGANIYYTTDGTDPDESDTQYTSGFSVSTTTTVKARAYKSGLDPSTIAENNYSFPSITTVSTIAELRSQTVDETYYQLTGEAILTYQQSYRGQKYIQDATAGILIDDYDGNITTSYNIYDGITGITGTLNEYGGMLQFVPSGDPGSASSTGNTITPETITLDDFNSNFEDYEAELIKIESVVFTDAGSDFENGQVYAISDGSKATSNFRTTFYDVDYIGITIPSDPQDIVCIANSNDDGEYVTSRDAADINPASSANPAVKLDITAINDGNPVYEGQDFSVTVQSQDVNGVPASVDTDIDVSLSVGTGSGTLGGTLIGTIPNGSNTITITGVTYTPHENGVILNVSDDAGNLSAGNSDAFDVLEVVIADLVITEIMYKAMGGTDTLEYIEIYNNGSSTINLEDYSFTAGVDLTFGNVNINSGAYLLIAGNASAIQDAFGLSAIEWSGGLSNSGELLELSDDVGTVVTSVEYGTGDPWPNTETGKSLRFCDPNQANNDPVNWSISVEFLTNIGGQDIYGTPLADCGAASLDADFEADNISILAGETVNFTDLSVGGPTTWSWTFEGGTPGTSDEENPANILYDTPGDYDVTLTISNGSENDTEVKEAYITVGEAAVPPIADFIADMNTVFVGQSVHFTDMSQNNPTTWLWTFDGGTPSSSTEENPIVVYSTAGSYDVTLYVENSAGNDTKTETDFITVLPALVGELVITEIMYNPPESGDDSLEYIEIYNNSDEAVNLLSYAFTSGIEYMFPDVSLEIDSYLVIAKNASAMLNTFGITAYEWNEGSALSNSGELIKLVNPTGITVDSVSYQTDYPWPEEANGNGPSLSICDPNTENSVGDNWHASVNYLTDNANGDAIFGSPEMAPAPIADFTSDYIYIGIGDVVTFEELSTCNAEDFEWEFEGGSPSTSNTPNPVISYSQAGDFDVTLTVSNSTGSHSLTLLDYIHVGVGTYEQEWSSIKVSPNPSNGIFKVYNPLLKEMHISVYNIIGEKIQEMNLINGDYNFDLLDQQNGMYFLHIVIGDHQKTIKIIKQ